MLISNPKTIFVIFVIFNSGVLANYDHNREEDDTNQKETKIISKRFWDILKGQFSDTSDELSRWSDNLELANGQMGKASSDTLSPFSDKTVQTLNYYKNDAEGVEEVPEKGDSIPGWFLNIFKTSDNWWEGENVCIDREEVDDSESKDDVKVGPENKTVNGTEAASNFIINLKISTCTDSVDKYSCVNSTEIGSLYKTVKVTYRCCHGYVRYESGCRRVNLFGMPETLKNLDSTSFFINLIKAADLMEVIKTSNLTIFVPTNGAIAEYTSNLEEQNEIKNNMNRPLGIDIYHQKREIRNLAPTLLGHMTKGITYAGDCKDEMILPSLNKNSPLRINLYRGISPVVTVNCARIVTANHQSLNGIVHTVDKVIQPVVKTILDIVSANPKFSILKQLLNNSSLVEDLGKSGQFTLFAPTDTAFRRLKPSFLESLLEGTSCFQEVVKQHIINNTICSTSIQGKMKTKNLLNEYLIVERNEDDKIFVNDAQIVTEDIVGTNGVVHMIDKALIPNEAKSVGEVLQFHNLTKFIELLDSAQLADEFDSQKNITIFAPTNNAIESIPQEELIALKSNLEKLREVLRYHMTIPSMYSKGLKNNQLPTTAAGHPLRINLYSPHISITRILKGESDPMTVTAGCSRVSLLDTRACGAVVHVIESVLDVPKSNILAALEEEKFSLFKQMVEDIGIKEKLEGKGPYTVLAPTDHVLKSLPADELEKIMKSQELKKKIVKKHILKELICCSGINPEHWLHTDLKRPLYGSEINIQRADNGTLIAGSAEIIKCGSPTTNGIVHTLNGLLLSKSERSEIGYIIEDAIFQMFIVGAKQIFDV